MHYARANFFILSSGLSEAHNQKSSKQEKISREGIQKQVSANFNSSGFGNRKKLLQM